MLTNQVNVKGQPIDIRTDGGLEIIPDSQTEHGVYEWLGGLGAGLKPKADLPVACIGWTRSRARRVVKPTEEIEGERAVLIRRARGYLAAIEGAVSGQGGHKRTFRTACVLVQKFGLTVPEAWPLFQEWNETCEPPWSDTELMHKLLDAEKSRK